MVNANMTKEGSLIWKIGRKVEDFTYRSADKIIVISEDFKRNIMAKGVPEDKIVVVPNWVDPSSVYPVERKDNILFDRYGLDRDKFYICYSGNIGHSQNLRLLLDAAKALKEELPDMRLVLIGEGVMKDELEEMIRAEDITNVIMLPFQPYEDIAHVFSLGDAGLIISKAGIGGSSVPSKTWSIMAAERPIVASFDENSRLSQLIREADCGIAVEADNLDALVSAVKTLYNDRQAGETMGKTGRKYLVENLDKEKCVTAYVDTLKDVIAAHQKGKE
jgi:glycosyltransferase involved in cell wall biosynthesis